MGLAVDDIKGVQETAALKRLALLVSDHMITSCGHVMSHDHLVIYLPQGGDHYERGGALAAKGSTILYRR